MTNATPWRPTATRLLCLIFAVNLACAACLAADMAPKPSDRNVHFRGDLDNSQLKFERDKQGHVAFIGGSITEMNGYRPMVCQILQERFPETEFTFTDAGIASTCSTTGAMRLKDDVLSQGPVDLIFIEFAVNDDQDATHPLARCIRGMEGLVRHVREYNPNADIVITYFVNEPIRDKRSKGELPTSITGHQQVAEHYDISTIDLAMEVAQQIDEGSLTWKQFGGTHPAPYGNSICAQMIGLLLDEAWAEPLSDEGPVRKNLPKKHALPDRLDSFCYDAGQWISPEKATHDDNWTWGTPDWKSLPGNCRDRFVEMKLLSANTPGAELTLDFEGTAIGAYVLAGPDAGIVECRIDDLPPVRVDLYHRFSSGLHYPRTPLFNDELSDGKHTLRLTVAAEQNEKSKGNAVRILQFATNPRR